MDKMTKTRKEIKFLDSFSAETAIVPQIIDTLIFDLRKMDYPQDEIDEIILSMDEAITNAIQETININKNINRNKNSERREVTVRYTISEDEFDATIIDHGHGLDIFHILESVPDKDSQKYHDEVLTYASKSEEEKIRVRINGKDIPLRGIGAGLKIILNFMDTVTIDFIDKEKVLSDSVSKNTDGTIFNMKRKRKYQ